MYPEANQNVYIKVNGHEQSWKAIVAEVRDKEILINFPLNQIIVDLLQIGTIIEVSFVSDENRYKFSTEIIGRKITFFKLKKPVEKEIISIQLRKNFRAPINIPLFLNGKKAITINISSDGISCLCRPDLRFKRGEVVSGTISLPSFTSKEENSISFKCEIIRVNIVKDLERNNIALKFIEIAQQDKMKIKQYCFEKQQLRMKNSEVYISTTGFRVF